LRDAFYPQVLASPIFSGLKERGASLDVAPPGAAELAEIVRAPAEAAGLVYDKDSASGETGVARERQERGVEPDRLPASLEDGAFKVVVEDHPLRSFFLEGAVAFSIPLTGRGRGYGRGGSRSASRSPRRRSGGVMDARRFDFVWVYR